MAYGTLNAGAITPGSGNTLTISEAVIVPTPTATTHAATKSYVDTAATQATTAAQGVGTGNSPTFAGLNVGDGNITNVGNIALDTISSDAGTSIGVTLGTDAGDDFNVGSGKLLVSGDTGFCGIGTENPDTTLELSTGASTTGPILRLSSSPGGPGNVCGGIEFFDLSSSENIGCKIESYSGASASYDSCLRFLTNTRTDLQTASVKMTILGSGNCGIGTLVPDTTLELSTGASTTGPILRLSSSPGGGGSVHGGIEFFDLTSSENIGCKIESYSDTASYDSCLRFLTNTRTDLQTASVKMTILGSGNVGIATESPGYTLDVDGNIGYSGTITDYSLRRIKEDIEEVDGSGFIDKFKKVPLYRFRYKPQVDKEELKDFAFREFGTKQDAIDKVEEVKWAEGDTLPKGIKVGEIRTEAVNAQAEKWEWEKWDEIFPNGYDESKMWDCPDSELKTFLDKKADGLRAKLRTEYHQKHQLHFGLIADDEALAENFPEVLAYREFNEEERDNEIWGIKPTAYIGMLHGVIKELVQRVETLENA